MEELELVISALASALGIDAHGFIASIKGEKADLSEVADLPSLVKAKASEQVLELRKQAQKRFTKEVNTKWRRALASEGFSLPEGELEADALVPMFKESITITNTPGELTKESLVKLPIFKEAAKELTAAWEKKFSDKENEFVSYKKTEGAKVVRSIASQIADKYLTEKKAILEVENGPKKESRLKTILQDFDFTKMKLNEKGDDVILLDDDGEELVDNYGRPVKYTSRLHEINDSLFGWHTFDTSKKGAEGGKADAGKKSETEYVFATEAEYNSAFIKADAATRAKMSEAYYAGLEAKK